MRALVPEPMRADLDPLLDVLRARRRAARRAMVRALRSERARDADGANGPAFLDGAGAAARRRAARRGAGRSATSRARGSARSTGGWSSWAARSTTTSPAEAYHELRKKGKELRYLLELFGAPLYAGEVVKPMIKTLKALQDVLGRHQDREVQVAMLRALRRRGRGAARTARAALMAMGVLVERAARGRARRARASSRPAFAGVRLQARSASSSRRRSGEPGPRHLQHQGRRGEDLGGGQPGLSGGARRAPTLLWDLDPQGATTYLFRVKPKVRGGGAQAGAR